MSNEVDGPAIERAFATSRAAWPGIEVDRAHFEQHVRARVEGEGGVPLISLHAGDLYFTLAAAAGNPAAIAAFERHLAPDVRRALAKLRLGAAAEDELAQRVRHKLFVADPGSLPRILTYSGKGPLRAWLRALVVHEAMSEHRRRGRDAHETDSALGDLATDDDPELAQIRARYAAPFREAFQCALTGLTPRERNVLRLVYTDGLSVEQVALMYGVHRVSVSRWLGQTRKDLFERTRASLRDRLHLDESELASLTRLCLSQIDVSLDRLLNTP